jgi:hypothetical protein
MRPEVLEPLACTLEHLVASGESAVEVFWVGEQAVAEVSVTPTELAALARGGQLATRMRYVVSGEREQAG